MRFLRVALLLQALPLLVQSQVCAPVPSPGTQIVQSNLDELRKRGAIAPGVSAFASLESFASAFGGSLPYVPQSAAEAKFWADFTSPAEYVTLDGSLDTSNPATWSEFSMSVYGRTIASFYQDRATAKDPVFRRIPRFKRFTVSAPADMNMLLGVGRPGPRVVTMGESPYPLARLMDDPVGDNGKQWSWPRNHIARFHPDTGQLEVCDYQEYSRAYPIVTTVSVGGGPGGGRIRIRSDLNAESFLSNVGAALFGGTGSAQERATRILALVQVE